MMDPLEPARRIVDATLLRGCKTDTERDKRLVAFLIVGAIVIVASANLWDRTLSDQARGRVTTAMFSVLMLLAIAYLMLGGYYVIRVMGRPGAKPSGLMLDALLPPEEAEHRILAIEHGYERWCVKFSPRRAAALFYWHALVTIAGYWCARFIKWVGLAKLLEWWQAL